MSESRSTLLMICHGCGERMRVGDTDWEAQRSFKSLHLPAPCPLGSGGKPWPKKRWVSDRTYEIGNEPSPAAPSETREQG